MDLDLDGRTVLVTGGSQGIGRATAEALVAEGATVTVVSRSGADVPGAASIALDLTEPSAARELAAAVGDLDVLVNNLGGVVPSSMRAEGFLDVDDETWQATYELNFFATVRVTRALLPGLLRRRGLVVNVSSIGARAAYKPVDYGTAKAALNNLTKALSEEFGAQGLRAVTVTPGPTRTQNWSDPQGYAGFLADQSGRSLEDFLADVPQAMSIATGRLTEPSETAALIVFLASGRSGNLTGADFVADGGVLKTV